MQDFFTALQFLTRIKIYNQTQWDEGTFARSVAYFPAVGLVIAAVLVAVYKLLVFLNCSSLLIAVLLIITEIIVTGGLLCDGFMDTADGVFSGRERERILEIMKDSCVGSNAVLAFVSLVLLKLAVYLELNSEQLTLALYAMPIITRTLMVYNIRCYSYARKSGIGGMFASADKKIVLISSTLLGLALLAPTQNLSLFIALVLTIAYNFWAANYLKRILHGLTGDTYGALAESGNVFFLLSLSIVLNLIK
ncbi:adenosylcobinamide-GDP ribazoletransferase [Succinispira mobilis]|uniref:adenosylcobinamide-GDP ribazoletransferase n=1 Tax=Succinispira mobilis TaxID=78120 RepID=UPI000362A219|nr:adenosylcobinamide-GDP ribazoletransferase [Succinispira mobilis]